MTDFRSGSGLVGQDGRVRAVIDAVRPEVDGGRFPIKRIQGDVVKVEADCFADGHDSLRVMLCWREAGASQWHESEMRSPGNDLWEASFVAGRPGRYEYTVLAWVDHFLSWRNEFARRDDAADIVVAAQAGAALVESISARAPSSDRRTLLQFAQRLKAGGDPGILKLLGLDEALWQLAGRHPDRSLAAQWPRPLAMVVDRDKARFSAWYELFPRSTASEAGRHGTLRDVEARLDYVAALGFDVLYLPPIHPIGRHKRKGRNNAVAAAPGDVGSPWAIGAAEGGHKAILPELGSIEDFRRLVGSAHARGIELALDIAYQCAPDHPYVERHPQWFRKRPDGSIQYAENPPKKYQDIYPFDFETQDWQALWLELKSILDFWVGEGVNIFRVDNPHTKAFAFWEWAISEVKRDHPEVLFLAEAFTRPKPMHRLAKLGFCQSYTYFAWRNSKQELTEYFTELTQGPGRDYFRPNVWPNTPDILTEALQNGGRPVFMARLVLAATLSTNYGIYGPAYELMEAVPRDPGTEEYLDSEKYQIRHWDLERDDSLRHFIALVNRIRRGNPALHRDSGLQFLPTDNDHILCYSKQSADLANQVLVVVNLDPLHVQTAWVDLSAWVPAMGSEEHLEMHDLLTGAHYQWQAAHNFVSLDPARVPAHVFRVTRSGRASAGIDLKPVT